jgi:hypothetical protein
MKPVAVLILSLAAALAGCRVPGARSGPSPTPACTCGEPMTDFEGCAHPLCAQGLRNPDNPDCVCGPLELEPQGGGK